MASGRKFPSLLTLLVLLVIGYWGIRSGWPTYRPDTELPLTEFSTDRAAEHVTLMAVRPHAVGSPAHAQVRGYIMEALTKLGLEPQVQEGYTAGDWGNFSKAVNVLARIPGRERGKALMLLAHYDSNPHSSLGASDDASGVATILEGIRAYLAQGKTPRNDIIILITDAEELGLNGAELFVREHPWTKEVGLVLNFEARGSGGPSMAFIETNSGNAALINAFAIAKPGYPMANSLYYSLYKLLPNDTDLTVFRELGDIAGFNFAFIDDHYDYHTALDNVDRMDRASLMHQGSYLTSLMEYFSETDLSDLKAEGDKVYFPMPLFGMVLYPFSWIWPMYGFACLLFFWIVGRGLGRGTLTKRGMAKGAVPMILVLITSVILGFFGWRLLLVLYPGYGEILQGFPYNGHWYMAAFVSLALGLCFSVYSRFSGISVPDLLVFPILLWLGICGAVSYYLPGAAFLIVPVLVGLAAFMVTVGQRRPSTLLLILLVIPAIWILGPFIQALPIGLGMRMIAAATGLVALTFGLLLPVFGHYPYKHRIGRAWIVLALFLFVAAHFESGFSKENPRPSSLVYIDDTRISRSFWATYDQDMGGWADSIFGSDRQLAQTMGLGTFSSKYGTKFTFVADAGKHAVPEPVIEVLSDTVLNSGRHLEVLIKPQRPINRLEVFADSVPIRSTSVNGVALSGDFRPASTQNRLFTHFVSDGDSTVVRLVFPPRQSLTLTVYESSNDLLTDPVFGVPPRPGDEIPKPFVLNDAVTVIKTLTID